MKIELFESKWEDTLVRIAGGESLTKLCKEIGIDKGQAHRWIMAESNRRKDYEYAYLLQADSKADMIDDLSMELIEKAKEMTSAEVQAYNVALQSMKWSAANRNSAKYGDRQKVEIESPDKPGDVKDELERLKQELGPRLAFIKPQKEMA